MHLTYSTFSASHSPKCLFHLHAHTDGTPLKTEKADLTRKLECEQETALLATNLPVISASVIDGGIIIHETVLQHSESTYGTMAKDLLERVFSGRGEQIHLVLDKCQSSTIKDPERNLRQSTSQPFIITGPDHAQRQGGIELLSSSFKEEFAKFVIWIMEETRVCINSREKNAVCVQWRSLC